MLKSKKNIILIGMMGCGKTTIARLLKDQLKMNWIDMDIYIEDKYQMSIPQMFDISEDYFRERETACCLEIAQQKDCIISTGGGVVKRKQNCDILRDNGIVIYLDRPVENIIADVTTADRPLLKDGPEKLYELYDQRHQLYLDACDYHINNDGTLEQVIAQIESIIANQDKYNV